MRTTGLHAAPDRIDQGTFCSGPAKAQAECAGKLLHIGCGWMNAFRFYALSEHIGFNFPIAVIIPDEENDIETFVDSRSKLRRRKLQSTITDNGDDRVCRVADGSPDCPRRHVAKCTKARCGVEPASRRRRFEIEISGINQLR